MIRLYIPIFGFLFVLSACSANTAAIGATESQKESVKVISPDQVNYIPLNPARGDSSPRAGVLWGDIRMNTASGVLLQFADGFSSPPHIHNVTYRGVVISGELHNDDPDAAKHWMDQGSFWTQPAGENHITAARPGSGATAFLEILTGPYLVKPSSEQFDNEERPINLQKNNMVWMGVDQFEWLAHASKVGGGPEVVLLWGDLAENSLSGTLIKLPPSYSGSLVTSGGDLKSVVIQGELAHQVTSVTKTERLGAGGYFESDADVPHALTCRSDEACILYLRTPGEFEVR